MKEEAKRIGAASENTKQIRYERQIAASKLAKENSAQDVVLEHMQTQWRRQLTVSETKQTKEHNKEVTKQAKTSTLLRRRVPIRNIKHKSRSWRIEKDQYILKSSKLNKTPSNVWKS